MSAGHVSSSSVLSAMAVFVHALFYGGRLDKECIAFRMRVDGGLDR